MNFLLKKTYFLRKNYLDFEKRKHTLFIQYLGSYFQNTTLTYGRLHTIMSEMNFIIDLISPYFARVLEGNPDNENLGQVFENKKKTTFLKNCRYDIARLFYYLSE